MTTVEHGRRTTCGALAVIHVAHGGQLFGTVTDAGLEVSSSWDDETGVNLEGIADWDLL